MSNALGTINPVERDRRAWRTRAASPVLVDGVAGGVSHAGRRPGARLRLLRRDRATSCTARPASACSTARRALLEAMPPFMGGGDMIARSPSRRRPGTTLPYKFEAGHAEHRRRDRARRGARLHRRRSARDAIAAHERDLLDYGTAALRGDSRRAPDRHGAAARRASCRSCMDGVHPHDIGTIVDREGVAIRTGHHCAQPVMDRFGIPATARASLAMYNTREEIDALGRALEQRARGVRLMSDLSDLYQEVILDHNRRPRNFRALDDAEPPRRRLQPALRRSAEPVSCRSTDDVITDVGVPGLGLRDLEGLGVADDRQRQGTTGRRGARAVRAVSPDGDDAARPGGRGPGQAVGAGRRARVPGAREVREPGLAHAQGRARARSRRRRRNEA